MGSECVSCTLDLYASGLQDSGIFASFVPLESGAAAALPASAHCVGLIRTLLSSASEFKVGIVEHNLFVISKRCKAFRVIQDV